MTTLAACLAWYYYSGAAQVAKTAKDGHRYLHERRGTIEQKSVGTSTATRAVTTAREGKGVRLVGDGAQELEMEAKTKWLRAAARNYGQYIPSTVAWIDVAFDELDDVRAAGGKNRQEVDRAVRECYDDMEVFGQRALGKDDAREAWVLLGTYLRRVHEIAEKERERGKEKAAVNTDEPSRKGRWWIVK